MMRRVVSMIGRGVAVVAVALLPVIGQVGAAQAAEGGEPLPKQKWSFDGIFGRYDHAALQRGFLIYKEVCSACHSMNLMAYRNLTGMGVSEAAAKEVAATVETTDGPNDAGEMFQRPGELRDHFYKPFANEKAARAANNGALPPDLSLMAKARAGGPDHIYGILTGYEEPPAGFKLGEGMNYNKYFPGHQIAMAQPLQAGDPAPDGTPGTLEQKAHDVAAFLMYAAEPKLEDRKRTGVKVILFLLVLTGLLYAVKRKIWAAVH
jgi:ubiquinol-cytochrome c reductase cytochrome c1 subunit